LIALTKESADDRTRLPTTRYWFRLRCHRRYFRRNLAILFKSRQCARTGAR